MSNWQNVASNPPPQHVVLLTKISDQHGERNEARLILEGRLWFFEDYSIYVYYTPTHWKYP